MAPLRSQRLGACCLLSAEDRRNLPGMGSEWKNIGRGWLTVFLGGEISYITGGYLGLFGTIWDIWDVYCNHKHLPGSVLMKDICTGNSQKWLGSNSHGFQTMFLNLFYHQVDLDHRVINSVLDSPMYSNAWSDWSWPSAHVLAGEGIHDERKEERLTCSGLSSASGEGQAEKIKQGLVGAVLRKNMIELIYIRNS